MHIELKKKTRAHTPKTAWNYFACACDWIFGVYFPLQKKSVKIKIEISSAWWWWWWWWWSWWCWVCAQVWFSLNSLSCHIIYKFNLIFICFIEILLLLAVFFSLSIFVEWGFSNACDHPMWADWAQINVDMSNQKPWIASPHTEHGVHLCTYL